MTSALLLLIAGFNIAGAEPQTPSAPPSAQGIEANCSLSPADKEANRVLSFAEFDQQGATPVTARQLGNRNCNAEAASATEDYLLFGPTVTEYERNVLTWHMAQFLGLDGREAEAARLIASSRRGPSEEPDGFDWNTYVIGTWAFLVKDRPALDQASATLAAAPGVRNSMNGRVLRRLQKCFTLSYREAYQSPDCEVPA
jgi:hypothetical protein